MVGEILYTRIHEIFRRLLENIQDIIIIGVCIILFVLMLKIMAGIVSTFFQQLDFKAIAGELIYILVLLEIYRLLIIYLREHRVAVDIMIEVGIVAILREIILLGILDIDPLKIIAISILFIALVFLLRYGSIRKDEIETEKHGGFINEIKKTFDKNQRQAS
jgi:uncharacterized membrane protein (DUF373 family)